MVSFGTEEKRPWHIDSKSWLLVEGDHKIPQRGRIMLQLTFESTLSTYQAEALQFESNCMENVMHIELSNTA